MSDCNLLDIAIRYFKSTGSIYTEDGIRHGDIAEWLEELKERRKESNTEYDMRLVRRQWEDDDE